MDGLVCVSVPLLVYLSVVRPRTNQLPWGEVSVPYLPFILVLGVLWFFVLVLSGTSSSKVLGVGTEEYRRVLLSSAGFFGALAILAFLFDVQLARSFFAVILPVGTLALLVMRMGARARLTRLRQRGRALRRTVVLGGARSVHLVKDLRKHPDVGLEPVEAIWTASARAPETVEGLSVTPFTSVDAAVDQLRRARADVVAIASGVSEVDVRRLAWGLEDTGVELYLAPQMVDVNPPRISVNQSDKVPLLHVEIPEFSGSRLYVKRAFDIVASAIALLVTAPVLAAIAIAIKIDDGGPVIFRQERRGLHGEPFVIHKFRTMTVDAESRIGELIEQRNGGALLFKMKDDPRVTRIGQFLRSTSLDELPQFWTVLRGPMSVVGPRPQVAREVAEYDDDMRRRLLTKPGITGLWQVSGRSSLSVEESIRLDLRYVENWSLTGDIVLVLKTVRVILRGDGAY